MGLGIFFVFFVGSEISCQNVNISMVGKDVPSGNVRKLYLSCFLRQEKFITSNDEKLEKISV